MQTIQTFVFISEQFSESHFKRLLTYSEFHRNRIKNNNYNNKLIETLVNFYFISKIISVDITYIPKIQQHTKYYCSQLNDISISLVQNSASPSYYRYENKSCIERTIAQHSVRA